MTKLFLTSLLLLTLNSCSWLESIFVSDSKDPLFAIVQKSAQLYRERKLDDYFLLFDQNINVFNTNGLGTARVVSGLDDFKGFTRASQKAKTLDIEIIEHFTHQDWVFVKQKSTINVSIVEAAVGYRIVNNKIADIMIVGEKNLSSK